MDLTGVSKKGIKLINDNPGVSPYDLLEKGLSQKDYEKLAAQTTSPGPDKIETPQDEAPVVAVPKKVEVTSNKPTAVERPAAIAGQFGGAKAFRNKKTGKTGTMNGTQLDMLCRKYPDEFEKI